MGDNEKPRICEICQENSAKYTCPKCATRTCSLSCVKQHKKAIECSGERNKTAYISLNNFNDNILYSDYYFLEDVNRAVENSERGPRHSTRLKLPEKRERLCKNAEKIGVNLEFLPKGMARNRRNKSYYNNERKQIIWTIEWRLPEISVKSTCDGFLGDTNLKEAFNKFTSERNPVIRHKIEELINKSDCKGVFFVLFKAEKSSGNRYYTLDLNKSIIENLQKKVVIEYPCFILVTSISLDDYKLLNRISVADVLKDEKEEGEVTESEEELGFVISDEDL